MRKFVPPSKEWEENIVFLSKFIPRRDAATLLSRRKKSIDRILSTYYRKMPKKVFDRIRSTAKELRDGKSVAEIRERVTSQAILDWAN